MTEVSDTVAQMKGIPTREELMAKLKNETLVVTFLKLDGDRREMTCTLQDSIVPPTPAPKALAEGEVARVKKPNTEVCNVWDVNAQGWRSFRYDRVEKVKEC